MYLIALAVLAQIILLMQLSSLVIVIMFLLLRYLVVGIQIPFKGFVSVLMIVVCFVVNY